MIITLLLKLGSVIFILTGLAIIIALGLTIYESFSNA